MEQYFIARIRRYYDLELPRFAGPGQRWPLLIALHGFRGKKGSMMRLARRIAAGRMIAISLQGPYQFYFGLGKENHSRNIGFGWGTSFKMEESIELHHRDLRALISLATRQYRADPKLVFLLGFSQACSYNYRFVFTYPGLVCGVIAVCGGIPGDWNQNPRYRPARTHVLHIAATRDEWYAREKNLEFQRQLAERAASLDFRFYKSRHRFPRAAIPHIRGWIRAHS